MANASSGDAAREPERPAESEEASSLGSALLFRAVAFIVLMFVVGYFIDFLASEGVVQDSEMINVLIGIFLSLGFLGILLSVVVGLMALVRRFRR